MKVLTMALSMIRIVIIGWWLQSKIFAISGLEGFLQLIWPLFFATGTFLIYRQAGNPELLIYAGLGSAVMGTWSCMATNASDALQRERWQGTLQLLVTTPTPFAVVLVPVVAAMSTVAAYSLAATLVWGKFVLGIPLIIASPLVFIFSLVVTIGSVSMLGFLLAVCAVRYRTAWALGNALEYPGWLLCGFIVPISVLPSWAEPISLALPPTWGMAAMRLAADGAAPWREVAFCAALGIVYLTIAVTISEFMLRAARRTASLTLT